MIVGCGHDRRPTYEPPELPPTQAVTLGANGGWFIDGVDGRHVDGAKFRVAGTFGGNGTVLSPGAHRIIATLVGGNVSGTAKFTFEFLAGHTYLLDSPGLFDKTPRLTDQTLGVVVKGSDED